LLEKPARTLAHRARNPELTRREILEAARAEFAERGLDGARVDRIAERAGANKRMIYHYFNSKDALYSAVLEDVYREIRIGEFGLDLEHKAPKRVGRVCSGGSLHASAIRRGDQAPPQLSKPPIVNSADPEIWISLSKMSVRAVKT
jgi:AcrR family transcriptional regulator